MTPQDAANLQAYWDGYEEGIKSVLTIRCRKHVARPAYNHNEAGGGECGACIAASEGRWGFWIGWLCWMAGGALIYLVFEVLL